MTTFLETEVCLAGGEEMLDEGASALEGVVSGVPEVTIVEGRGRFFCRLKK
jgi:hypothetical protein